MDKTIYQSKKEESKRKLKELKKQYKTTHRSFLKKWIVDPFYRANKKIGSKIHKKRNDIRELKAKTDYIVESLKATLNTTDEIRKKTIEDIVQNIDDL